MIKKYDEKLIISIHEKAKRVTGELRRKEWEVILAIQEVIKYEVYRKYKYPSLFKYLTLCLELTEDKAHEFSVVAHASIRFEKLHLALEQGKISVAKARRITSVLTEDNQEEWIDKAKLNSHRRLERIVASQNPEAVFFERARYISENQVEVVMIMTVKEFEYIKRPQDLLSQKQSIPVSMKDSLVHTSKYYSEKNDPVIKAVRHQEKELKKSLKQLAKVPGTCQESRASGNRRIREPVARRIYYQVNLRDGGQCQEQLPNGEKCQESRWIDIHHVKPVSHGGDNSLQNLITLCKGHHRLEHS